MSAEGRSETLDRELPISVEFVLGGERADGGREGKVNSANSSPGCRAGEFSAVKFASRSVK